MKYGVLRGGRGASSGRFPVSPGGKSLPFYDRTDKFKGMTLDEFENEIKNRKHEFVGFFDENGKLIGAGTSYNKGAVAIPSEYITKATILTHNHPSDGNRGIGGTFSEADMLNHFAHTNLKSTRATAKERTYIMANKGQLTAKQSSSLYSKVARIESSKALSKAGNNALKIVSKKFKNNGKTMSTTQTNTVYLGGMKTTWKKFADRNSSAIIYAEKRR